MKHFNVIGPQVRRLRNQRAWSQNDFAIKLQLLGMENATRAKISKIESRLVWISDDDLIFLSRALGVAMEELYPDFIRTAKRLYEAISMSKASRYGAFIFGLISCSQLGAGVFHFATTVAGV
ncbi:MAG: helix-turn-helix transcriptional regulator [Candidatus Paceibacterota bacterium]|jgi:transcriptional regulator with XRE-family HTH domain